MSDSYDDWDENAAAAIEDYLEDRLEEYLEQLEIDPYDVYYNDYNTPKVAANSNDKYQALLATYVSSLERLITHSKSNNHKPTAYTVIAGSGPAWFYEPSTRKMIKTERGSEIVVIPGEPDEQGRLLVRTMNTFLLIPADDVLSLGYN